MVDRFRRDLSIPDKVSFQIPKNDRLAVQERITYLRMRSGIGRAGFRTVLI